MSTEKSQALYIPTDTYGEKNLNDRGSKFCPRLLVWILVALLIALVVGLCVEFWFPVKERLYVEDNVATVKVYDAVPMHTAQVHSIIYEKKTSEVKAAEKDEKSAPWHLDFLINPTRLCETKENPESETYQKNPEVKVLILVPSATGHFVRRNTIRRTWGSVAEQPHGPVRLGFVLGVTPNSTEESLIRHESESFGDIIQADFVDSFRNLTTKSVLTLKWVSAHCPHARYFLKTDDDTFVNMPVLAQVLHKPVYDPKEAFVGGYVRKGAVPTRVPSEKYFISDDFPEIEFPPYADGSAYLTTGPTAAQLFSASQRVTPFLPFEDIFITGLCADDINAKLVHEPSFRFSLIDDFPLDGFSSLATIHSLEPSDMDAMWDQMAKAIMEALDSPTNFRGSSDPLGSISISDLFEWPEKTIYTTAGSKTMTGGPSEIMKPSEGKTILDIFNLMKNQLDNEMEPMEILIDSDLDDLEESTDSDTEELEVPDQTVKKVNKGNLLSLGENKVAETTINGTKANSSSLILVFK